MTEKDAKPLLDLLLAQAEKDFTADIDAAELKYWQRVDALNVVGSIHPSEQTILAAQLKGMNLKQRPLTPRIEATVPMPEPLQSQTLEQPSVIESVRRVLTSSPERAWRVADIEQELTQKGFKFTAKEPKSTINTALFRLVDQGEIEVAVRGKGRQPSLYKASDRSEVRSENPNEQQEQKDAAA